MLLAVMLLATAGLGVASGNSIPHPDLRLSLFSPPGTMPADTAFWVGAGFASELYELPADVADESDWFELYVDGSAEALRKDLEFRGGAAADSVSIVWYKNFTIGLPAGSHHFEGRWYANGALVLDIEADVLFE